MTSIDNLRAKENQKVKGFPCERAFQHEIYCAFYRMLLHYGKKFVLLSEAKESGRERSDILLRNDVHWIWELKSGEDLLSTPSYYSV
jgi:hypothetical protein